MKSRLSVSCTVLVGGGMHVTYFSMKQFKLQGSGNKNDENAQSKQEEKCNDGKKDVPALITLNRSIVEPDL